MVLGFAEQAEKPKQSKKQEARSKAETGTFSFSSSMMVVRQDRNNFFIHSLLRLPLPRRGIGLLAMRGLWRRIFDLSRKNPKHIFWTTMHPKGRPPLAPAGGWENAFLIEARHVFP
jgi:hypothetical protein